MRLVLLPKKLEGVAGLDLVVLEPDATVWDLAEAFEPFSGCNSGVYKRKLRGDGACRACASSCCTTSIIAPDPISFASTARFLGLPPDAFLEQHFDAEALDAGVLRLSSYPCTFLASDGTCSIYPHRSLICRFFICTPYSPVLEELVHNILGAGLAALQTQLHGNGLVPSPAPAGYTAPTPNEAMAAYEQEFDRFYRRWVLKTHVSDEQLPLAWYENPFQSGTEYRHIPLAAFTTEEQWRVLTRGALPLPFSTPRSHVS